MPRVFNVKHRNATKDAIYIGRGTPYGNPYRIGVDGTRSEVINKFKAYALKRLRTEPDWLSQIAGKDLICHCVPEDCHGDVIIELCKEFYDEVD